jgi:hypothetical protein
LSKLETKIQPPALRGEPDRITSLEADSLLKALPHGMALSLGSQLENFS